MRKANQEIKDKSVLEEALNIIMQQHGAKTTSAFDPKQIDALTVLKLNITKLSGKQSSNWEKANKTNNAFIGEAGISLSNDRFKLGEIFYNLSPEYWACGYATEIAKSLIEFGFNKLGLHKIEAGVATENIASIKVLEKAGMQREGLRRKILPIRGQWKDNYHYAIVEDGPR